MSEKPEVDTTSLPIADARRALDFILQWGQHLHERTEWEMDDNFNCTEGVYALYLDITDQEHN